MLKIDWYIEEPIDFEYKNYVLLDYIQQVDKSFQQKVLSPYLLWTEAVIKDMRDFQKRRSDFLKSVEKPVLNFNNGTLSIVKSTIDEPENLKLIKEIIEYSSPILESKIQMGYHLLKKYPQILY